MLDSRTRLECRHYTRLHGRAVWILAGCFWSLGVPSTRRRPRIIRTMKPRVNSRETQRMIPERITTMATILITIQREARERFRQVTSTVKVPEKDILAAFARLVETQRETLKRRCFCFFIDSLDEYEENATNRPQRHCESSWQVGQQGQGTIKLCVSTREHNVYMNTSLTQKGYDSTS